MTSWIFTECQCFVPRFGSTVKEELRGCKKTFKLEDLLVAFFAHNQIHSTKSVMKKAHSNEHVGFEPVTSCIAILIICCCQNPLIDGCMNGKEYLSLKRESMSEYIFYVIVFND